MKQYKIYITLLSILICNFVNGQDIYDTLTNKFHSADSIVLISYKTKYDSIQGLQYLLNEPMFFKSNIIARRSLDSEQKEVLINLLKRKGQGTSRKTTTRRFTPTEAILIFKNNNVSFIDICFNCNQINSSKNNEFDLLDMRVQNLIDIKNFFRQLSIIKP